MTIPFRGLCSFFLCSTVLRAAGIQPPPVPENLKPPATQAVLLKAAGSGLQIYGCQASQGKFEWVLEKPQAELLDEHGKTIGRHFEGPTWEASDRSQVVGEVLQRAPSPHPGSIPWLLLKAKSHQGAGTFSQVTYIQRVATKGGATPTEGCDQSHAGKETAVQYQAEYYFYTPRP